VVSTPGGNASRTFVVPPTVVNRYNSDTALPILDLRTVESSLNVSGLTSPISKVVVNFFVNHTFDDDLTFTLVGPDNTTANLVVRRGGSGDNFGTAATPDTNRTNLDDNAANPVTGGTAPFVGTFRPEQALAAFIGKTGAAANGTWKLRINDGALGDTGTLNNWSLLITTAATTTNITSFSPTSGAPKSSVVITGSNFTGATGVTFNGVAAAFGVNSDSQITATVPTGATTGAIAVTTPLGTATSGSNFTVLALPPVISNLSPSSGPVGTIVVITGSNFTGATAVKFFNNKNASFVVNSSTQITATVPTGAATGTIAVITPSGTGASRTKFVVTP
jgi:subtilisin-like proprotein convertase family protein